MAGPAIRTLELARTLAAEPVIGAVTVASLSEVGISDPAVQLTAARDRAHLRELVRSAGSVVVQGDVLGLHPWLAESDVPLVVDAYDPFHLEQLERTRGLGEGARRAVVRDCITALNVQLSRADLVLCASRRQRALWLGHLAALGRVNPVTYDRAPDLSALVAVVPFGTPRRPPVDGDRHALARAHPSIAPGDVVVVWGGGIYEWLDPVTLVRAMAEVEHRAPRLRLLFLGTRHPVAGVEGNAGEARRAAEEAGVLDRTVVFHEGWVPYEERDRWLRSADIAVSTHWDHLETEFAFRTRVLDYLWCGLPVITTAGDELADVLSGRGAGLVVPPGDVEALSAALLELAGSPGARSSLGNAARDLSAELAWDRVARPLVAFCSAPRRAPDLALDAVDRLQLGLRPAGPPRGTLRRRIAAALREGGIGLVARRLLARVPRR
ncbi:glycosyltransferase [Blastococcus sp. SYSU DS0541]